jgi:hypothetical protein
MLELLSTMRQQLESMLPAPLGTVAHDLGEGRLSASTTDPLAALRSIELGITTIRGNSLGRLERQMLVSECPQHPPDGQQQIPLRDVGSVGSSGEAAFRDFQVDEHVHGSSCKTYNAHGSICYGQQAGEDGFLMQSIGFLQLSCILRLLQGYG